MKIAVVADTHLPRGTRQLPDECIRQLADADFILHAGDFVAASVLEDLTRLNPVDAVYGNMDEPALRQLLPKRRVVEAEGVRIGMVHIPGPAAGRAARLADAFPGCHAIVYGHTHVPDRTEHDGVLVLNPGSPTERRRSPTRSMLLLAVAEGRLETEFVPLGA